MNRALKYAYDAIQGKKIVNKQTKQACQRFINDLERAKTPPCNSSLDFPYYYDEAYADKVIKFIEMLPTDNREPLKLLDFQVFLISQLFGWRTTNGGMRFKTFLYSCARKSGKSFIIASLALVYLFLEPGYSKQVLFTAGSLQQAHLAFDKAKNQLQNVSRVSSYMRRRFKITSEKIFDTETDSFAVPLATNGTNNLDGYGADLAVMDECANISNKVFEDTKKVLESGMIQNENGLLCMISTAGFNMTSSFKAQCDYACDILSGKVTDDRYLALIYSLDDPEEVYEPKAWVKANPILANKKIAETMQAKIQADLDTATKQGDISNVLVKNFNMWTPGRVDAYIDPKDWNKNLITPPNIYGKDAYIGIDLSTRNDLTSISYLIPLDDLTYYADSFSFIGTANGIERKERTDEFNYRLAAKRGECSITELESGIIDVDAVFSWLMNFITENNLNVLGIGYDPWNSNNLITKLEKQLSLPLVGVRQGGLTLNVPTRQFKDLLLDGRLKHRDNKLLEYAINNAVVKLVNNNWILNKVDRMSGKHIDPAAALINAYVLGMNYFDEQLKNKERNEYFESDEFSF